MHRATLLENREDATKLLRSPSLQVRLRFLFKIQFLLIKKTFVSQTNLCCHCRGTDQTCGTSRKASLQVNNSGSSSQASPPLPPPPPPAGSLAPNQGRVLPPPPPPPLFATNATQADASMDPPPIPPPLHVLPVTRAPTPEQPNNHARLLPQQEIPTPKAKMKTINWNKIPNHKVLPRLYSSTGCRYFVIK